MTQFCIGDRVRRIDPALAGLGEAQDTATVILTMDREVGVGGDLVVVYDGDPSKNRLFRWSDHYVAVQIMKEADNVRN